MKIQLTFGVFFVTFQILMTYDIEPHQVNEIPKELWKITKIIVFNYWQKYLRK